MTVLLNKTLNTNNAAGTGAFTTLERFAANTLSPAAGSHPYDQIRITLNPATASGNFTFAKFYIGHGATVGDAYDFAGDQVEVTFNGGQHGCTLVTSGPDVQSDIINFPLDTTRPVIIAYDGPAGSPRDVHTLTAQAGCDLYFQNVATGNDAATTNKTNYGTVASRIDVISKIEAFIGESSAALSSEHASSDHLSARASDAAASSDHHAHDASSSDAALSSNKVLHDQTSSQLVHDAASSSDFSIKTSWNPFDKTSGVTLSDADHQSTLGSAGVGGVRGTVGHNTNNGGRYYFEIFVPHVDQVSQFNVFGWATDAYNLASGAAYGGDANFRGIILGFYGGGGHFSMDSNTLRFAFDMNTREVQVALNGGAFFPPSKITTPGKTWYPAVAFENSIEAITATLNMGDRPFSYALPTGYASWASDHNGVALQGETSASTSIFDSIIVMNGPASGGGASTHTMARTIDAVNWSSETTPTFNSGNGINYDSICHSPELNKFVAIASVAPDTARQIVVSADGITWTQKTSAALQAWDEVCWSPDLRLFVAVSNDGTNRVMTSPDGETWTLRASADDTKVWRSVCWSRDLSLFVAVGTNCIMTSPDGLAWTTRTSPASRTWVTVLYADALGSFYAVASAAAGSNDLMRSTDGVTWTAYGNGNGAFNWNRIGYSPDLVQLMLIGPVGVNTSHDGLTWSRTPPAGSNEWSGIVWSRVLELWIIVGDGITDGHYIATSPNGTNWTFQTPPQVYNWNVVAEGLLRHESASSEFESMIDSLGRVSSDHLLSEAASSSDKIFRDAISSDKLLHDASSSSDRHLHDAKSSDDAASSRHLSDQFLSSDHALAQAHSSDKLLHDAASSSDKIFRDAASSSEKIVHDAGSSEFQSDVENEIPPPIQVVVIVS